ncbi:MAG: SDR family oxidoreductase [Bryobacteraceae bacterium]|nr:SDR family oxidoreductase [Bryobacteraceae bacterium]
MELRDAIIIITGAGRGIGRAIAKSLAAEGAHVYICSRTKTELEETAREIRESGGRCSWRVADVARSCEIDAFVSAVMREHGRLDAVIGNAGSTAPAGNLETVSDSDYKLTMSSNVDGLFFLVRAAVPIMRQQNRGWIVAVSSGAGLRGHSRLSVYSAAKFAIQGMMQALASEVEDTQIRVVSINPGAVNTRLLADLFGFEEASKHQPPEAVAAALIQILTEEHSVPNGGGVCIRGGSITETYSRTPAR